MFKKINCCRICGNRNLLDVLDAGSSSQRRRYSMAILAAMKGNRRALRDLDNLLGFL